MEINFENNPNLPADAVQVTVTAAQKGPAVDDLMAYLQRYQPAKTLSAMNDVITVKTADEILVIKVAQIILVDVNGAELLIQTANQQIVSNERLANFLERLNRDNFVQISKHAVINLDQLQSLSNSFSGNMTAILAAGNKSTVSRRYVKNLTEKLGL